MPNKNNTQKRGRGRIRRQKPKNSNPRGRGGSNFGSGTNFRPAVQRGPSAAATQLMSMPLQRVPHFQTGMIYYENGLALTGGGAGTIGNYFFRANDAFDPNQTGVGHQPMGFDQMMLLFEQFYVLRAHIRVRAYNTSGAGFFPVVGIALTPDATSIVSESAQEQGLLVSKVMPPKGEASDHVLLTLTCDCPRYFGVKRQPYIASSLYQGTAGNVPAEVCYFKLFIYDLAAANVVSVNFDVTITYDVYFQEPRQLGESLQTATVLADAFKNRKTFRKPALRTLSSLSQLRLDIARAVAEEKRTT